MTGLRLDRTTFTVDERDGRPALVLDDVRGASVKSLVATAPTGATPVAWLRSTRDCLLDGVRAPDAETLARLSGPETAKVRIVSADADLRAGGAPRSRVGGALRTQGNVTSKSWSERRRAAGADSDGRCDLSLRRGPELPGHRQRVKPGEVLIEGEDVAAAGRLQTAKLTGSGTRWREVD